MISNFEEITKELSESEMEMIEPLIRGFKLRGKDNPVKAPEIVRGMKNKGYQISEPRLRKCVNYIRSNGLLPLIATSNGYYVSYDKDEIKTQIKSLHQRASSIHKCAKGLEKFT